ncbi:MULTISPECIES: hypothetical protein [unclassified Streptomyces]|uniref:hypothetical protein n=1 Tax=unclassified Streptomyces TaxID=2593676 RepID=UPI002365DDF8|nr:MULTISPECIES: hypothetical protein [unclassified Streptomyces]MDF3139804.1 hypothetical protein [Streptomyces sp. T21Q-yed]WDF42466.1 hypothetical protein PBV52_39560 [Streptomyces sp. T12]
MQHRPDCPRVHHVHRGIPAGADLFSVRFACGGEQLGERGGVRPVADWTLERLTAWRHETARPEPAVATH